MDRGVTQAAAPARSARLQSPLTCVDTPWVLQSSLARGVAGAVIGAALLAALPACSADKTSDGAYAARLASALDADEGGDLGEKEAACVARAFVDLVGKRRLRSAAPEAASLPVARLKDFGLDAGVRVAGLLAQCGVDHGSVDVGNLQGLAGEMVRAALAGPYAEAIAGIATFDGSNTDLTREEAACVGRGTVEAAGLDALTRMGPPAKLTSAGSLAAAGLEPTDEAARAFAPAVASCGVQLRRILGAAFTRVSDQRVASCILGTLDDLELSRFAYITLVGELQAGPSPSALSVDLPFETCGFFGSAGQRAYVDAVIATLKVDPRFRAEGETATCVATAFVSTVTPKALDRDGISASMVRSGDLSLLGLAEPTAAAFVQAFGGCGTPPVPLLIQVFSRRTLVTPEREACLTREVNAVSARDVLVAMLTSPDGPQLTDAQFQKVAKAIVGCGVLADALS